ncbi:FimV/HubP family polar landmark protein, partial [Vibrio genomosp. F6]|uniref:FimV/HubP family polar landmark protein n=1 Tax=Vibrio genomosp. F6 TaxID=723172 RepID=UPI0003805F5C
MRQIYKRLLTSLTLIAATQVSNVHADSIRLLGPNGEVQTSPQYSEQVQRAQAPVASRVVSDEPSRFYGPTGARETLWSIASNLRPSNRVSVQQTLLAIYRLNPQAFENQNIHSLLPNQNLRVPSLEQVSASTTQQAIAIMDAHTAKLANTPTVRPVTKAVQPIPRTASSNVSAPSASLAAEKPVMEKAVTPKSAAKPTPVVKPAPSKTVSPVSSNPLPSNQDIVKLEQDLSSSETELTSLEEKNHQLRLMLADVQSEVDGLKGELGDESRIRSEVEKLLAEERAKELEEQKLAPTSLDTLLSNGWLVALLAIIPGLLLGLIVVLLLGRRSKSEETEAKPVEESVAEDAPIILGEDADELSDDLSLDDDLFGDGSDPDALFGDDTTSDDDDIFASLDDDDLDFNLECEDEEDPFAGIGDDGDLDESFSEFDSSSNGISVNGDEKALGLEEMERALDEVEPELSEEEEAAFDLSDEGGMSQDEIEKLLASDEPTEELEDDAVDQSFLDELLAGNGDDDDDDFDIDSLIAEQAPSPSSTPDPDDIDDIFAQVAAEEASSDEFNLDDDTDSTPAPTSNADASIDDIDYIFAQVAAEKSAEPESLASDDIDDIFAQFSTEASDDLNLDDLDSDDVTLLDEMLDDEAPLEAESTDLLDELLSDDDEQDLDLQDSSDLLDDLLSEDEPSNGATEAELENEEFDPIAELESLSGLSDDELLDLDENSTETLDELLGTDSNDETPELELDEDSTDLFDELLAGDIDVDQDDSDTLDELLSSELTDLSEDSVSANAEPSVGEKASDVTEPSFDEIFNSAIETNEQPEHEAPVVSNEVSSDSELDENSTELLDELLLDDSDDDSSEESLTSSESESESAFDRDDFIDDLFNAAPETDALLDDVIETTDQALADELDADLIVPEPEPEP